MGLRDLFTRWNGKNPQNSSTLNSQEFFSMLGVDSSISKDKLKEITYFTCLRLLAESVAKLPLKMFQDTEQGTMKVFKHPYYHLLRTRPNSYMTPSTFWAAVEINRNHYGNSYVYLCSGRRGIQHLWILPSNQVQVWMDDAGIFNKEHALWYIYTEKRSGKRYKFRDDEILHFKTSVSMDGITGLAIQELLKIPIENAERNSHYLNNYYKHGLMGKAVVYYTGDLSPAASRKMAERIEEFASGTDNAGKIVPLPLGFQLQPLNISMEDAQFLEISKYTALQIASAFGIKPSMINNYDKGNYANVETQQRDFYVNTLLAILKSYEEELSYKLLSNQEIQEGYRFKFNVNGILRADFKVQMEGLAKGVNNGIYTPNEARDMLDLPSSGDNGTFIRLADIGKQYGLNQEGKGGGNHGVDESKE